MFFETEKQIYDYIIHSSMFNEDNLEMAKYEAKDLFTQLRYGVITDERIVKVYR